ncbi:MAG TPA: hypothetical protein VII44_02200 [Puia sp.]
MLVIAQHNIQNPQAFWSAAQKLSASMPAGLKLLSVFPSKDMKTGTCLWEGESANAVQKFLDDNVGNISKNFCYEVDEAKAVGLPKKTMEATL